MPQNKNKRIPSFIDRLRRRKSKQLVTMAASVAPDASSLPAEPTGLTREVGSLSLSGDVVGGEVGDEGGEYLSSTNPECLHNDTNN